MKQIFSRYMLFAALMAFSVCAFVQNVSAQDVQVLVKGTVVTGEDFEPIVGAQILEKGTSNSAVTDIDGNFSIQVPSNATLIVSYIGYNTENVRVNGRTQIEVQLTEEAAEAKELINVAFGKKYADDILGGVSYVNMEELAKKDYTTYSIDDLSGIVSGWNGNSLWGMDNDRTDTNDNYGVVVLIDGVKRASNNVLPSEIAQVTFLKGAQAVALYGPKCAKGVILITTKRGTNDGLLIKVSANTGFHVAKEFPEYLGSAEYMTLYNEAALNDANGTLAKLPYSQQDIYNHASGINPYRYTDINYYSDEYIRKAYNRTETTAEISGGADRAHFYSNISFYNYEDLLNFGKAKDNHTNRLNVRGNVDLVVNNYIKGYANANATFYNGFSNKGNFWNAAATLRPNFPQGAAPLIPLDMIDPNATLALDVVDRSINIIDGKYFLGGTQATRENDIAAAYVAGETTHVSRQFQFDAGVIFDLDRFVKGLDFKTMFAIDYATQYNLSYDNQYAVYIPTWSNYNGKDVIVALTREGDEVHTGRQNSTGASNRQTITWNGHLDYDRMFGSDHHVTGMLLGNMWQTTKDGNYHRYSSANLGLHAGYDYKSRYYVDFNLGAVYSARLPKSERGALSPSVSLGWRFGKEAWFEGSILDDAMLSVSASNLKEDIDIQSGYDSSYNERNSFYLYESRWQNGGGNYTWNESFNKNLTYSTQGGNPGLAYVQRKEISANLRASLWKKALTVDFSYFANKLDGLLISNPTFFPSHLTGGGPAGSFRPIINNNVYSRHGFDFSINGKRKFGDVETALGVNLTYYDSELEKYDEIYDDDQQYRCRQGHPIDGIWGLESLGLFQSNEEIANAPEQKLGSAVKPGDIRYKDQNGDGIIDDKDEVFLAKGGWYGAPVTLGVNLTLKWKGFTFFALGTGNFGAYGIKGNNDNVAGYYYWASGERKYSAVVRDRWTPETASTATYPRLTAQGGQNNYRTSDFWLYKSDRFNIRKIQLTYDLPSKLFSDIFIQGVSVYLSGQDLLTISKERKHLETNIGSAPQTRFYNIGLKVTI